MKKRMLSLGLMTTLVATAVALYVYTGPNPNKRPKGLKPPAAASSGVSGFRPATVSGTRRAILERREGYKVASSRAEGEAWAGRTIKLPDKTLAGGGEPLIFTNDENTEPGGIGLLYENDLSIGSWRAGDWPSGMGPREYYASLVKALNDSLGSTETANAANHAADLSLKYQLTDIAGNPGYGRDKDYQLTNGKKDWPLPANVTWAQDGIIYMVTGPQDMPLAEVIEIAKSVANN